MLSEFLDITKDSKKLFEGIKILSTPYACEMNQYPTIFITFADGKREKRFVISTIKKQILKEWAKYDFVFEHSNKYDQIQHDLIKSVLVDFQSDSLEGMDDALVFFDGLLEKLLSQRSHGHYR